MGAPENPAPATKKQKRQIHEENPEDGPSAMEIDAGAQRQAGTDFEGFNSTLMKLYYGRLFPFREMYRWLSYGNGRKHPDCDAGFYSRREFSFTLEHDIYVRYQSFKDAAEMAAAVRDKCPHKIDIGAVFNVDPARRNAYSGNFAPTERELVFDVDMNDYDDIRTCCTGANVCPRCWSLMTIAIKVVDKGLREDFGFQHLLWVFSGRRGVHCWVCDSRARKLTNEQRAAITDYFRVYKGGEGGNKKVSLGGAALHPMLSRAYTEVLQEWFEKHILPDQKVLETEEQWEKVLELLPLPELREDLREKWRAQESSRHSSGGDVNLKRWQELVKAVTAAKKQNQSAGLRKAVEEIVFVYTYPRLDLEVSKHMNHLLKAPFCVHPKTGKVCVPIDPDTCEAFDPDNVPTISSLLKEINSASAAETPVSAEEVLAGAASDLKRTHLQEAVDLFNTSFLGPLEADCQVELANRIQKKREERAAKPTLAW